MTLHNYRSRQVHETLNGVNLSSSFRDMRSAKSGPNLWQIWQVFGSWASPYGANGHMTMTVHTYRPSQFHRTSNRENPSSGYRDMGSASLAAARPPARTVTTIPLQPGGLRGKKWSSRLRVKTYVEILLSSYYWNWCQTLFMKTWTRTIRMPAFWGYPPAASWLPILLSHIRSLVKKIQCQSYKFKEFPKFYFF